jgi:hypothetical protein
VLAPLVDVQAVRHAGHQFGELLLQHRVERELRCRAVVRIGPRLEVLRPEAMDDQRPLATHPAFALALVPVGAEGRVGGHGQQVEIEFRAGRGHCGFPRPGALLTGRLVLFVLSDTGRLDRIIRRSACKQRADHCDENVLGFP